MLLITFAAGIFCTRATAIANARIFTRIIKIIVYLPVKIRLCMKSEEPLNNFLKFSSPINFGDLEIPFHSVRE